MALLESWLHWRVSYERNVRLHGQPNGPLYPPFCDSWKVGGKARGHRSLRPPAFRASPSPGLTGRGITAIYTPLGTRIAVSPPAGLRGLAGHVLTLPPESRHAARGSVHSGRQDQASRPCSWKGGWLRPSPTGARYGELVKLRQQAYGLSRSFEGSTRSDPEEPPGIVAAVPGQGLVQMDDFPLVSLPAEKKGVAALKYLATA